MNTLLRQKLEEFLNKQIFLTLSHKSKNNSDSIVDAKHQTHLTSYHDNNESLKLTFEHGSTITIPESAIVKVGDSQIHCSYTSDSGNTISIILDLIELKTFQTQKPRTPYVREHKDAEGKITKIVIDIPTEEITFEQLSVISNLLTELLSDWYTLSLTKRVAGSSVVLETNLQFQSISVVDIPGESFLQCATTNNGEITTIDIPTTFVVQLQQYRISYEFDGIQYELTKSIK